MSNAINHPQSVPSNANAVVDTPATTVQPVEGAPQGGFSIGITIRQLERTTSLHHDGLLCEVDATHAPMTVVVDPNAKPEKMPFKDQVSLVC